MRDIRRDPVHKKIMATKQRLVEDDSFDNEEALTAAVDKRKFLLRRMLEERLNFNKSNDEDDETDS